ncbi:MAG TPA: hypothetical protein VKE22_27475 [Haliangiales bacterium]|nr:hypothetical protein [Haliangiales bacterium]
MILALLLSAGAADARRGVGGVGIGAAIGEPTGGTLEIWLSGPTSFDFLIGIGSFDDHNLYIHADFKVYPVDLAGGRGSVGLPLYLGIGGWIYNPGDNLYAGPRVPFGLALHFRDAPLQLFIEVAVKFWLVRPAGVDRVADADVNGGFRIFF